MKFKVVETSSRTCVVDENVASGLRGYVVADLYGENGKLLSSRIVSMSFDQRKGLNPNRFLIWRKPCKNRSKK